MKMDSRFLPEMCVSRDEERTALHDPELDAERSAIIATDGHVLVSIPVTIEEGDTAGMVSCRALEMAREEAKDILEKPGIEFDEDGYGPYETEPKVIGKEPLHIKANGACELDSGITLPRKREPKFPAWIQVVPPAERLTGRLCLSADLLKKIADALGSKSGNVTVDFDPTDSTSPMVVRTAYPSLVYESKQSRVQDKSFGVLMPVRHPDSRPAPILPDKAKV